MAHNDLGQVLEEQGRLEDALLHYRAAAKGLSRPLDPMVNIGHVLDKQGRYDEAIGYYGDRLRTNVLTWNGTPWRRPTCTTPWASPT